MRILTIVRNFGRRGTQRVAECFSSAYKKLEHEVSVLAFEHEGPRLQNYLERGIIALPPYQTEPEEALRQAHAFNPDLIHIHRSGVTRQDETRLLRALKTPMNCVLETNVFSRFDPDADPYIDLHGHLTRAGLYRWQRLESARSLGVGFYLPNLLDYDVWRAPSGEHAQKLRRELNIPSDALILGTIGKTHPRLGRVANEIVSGGANTYWVAIDDASTRRLVAALPKAAQRYLRLLPQTDSDETLTHYYSLFDLLLHWSSNGESFGMVLAESIAVGTPIVMPLQLHRDIGGIEVLGHEQGGLISGSSRSLAQTCRVALAHLPLLRQRIVQAQARHHSEYDMMTVATRALLAVRTILAAGTGREDRSRLMKDSGFEVSITRSAMDEFLRRHNGESSRLEAALFAVSHHPRFGDLRRKFR